MTRTLVDDAAIAVLGARPEWRARTYLLRESIQHAIDAGYQCTRTRDALLAAVVLIAGRPTINSPASFAYPAPWREAAKYVNDDGSV